MGYSITGGFGDPGGLVLSPQAAPQQGGGGQPASYPQPQGSMYQQNVNQAQDSYQNVMSGYANLLSGNRAAQAGQQAGYGAIQGQVANTLGYGGTPWGIAAPAAQAIGDTFAQQNAQTQQGLINSGLGNSTVLGSMQRGNALSAGRAYAGLGAQLAQTYAGYQSQLGLAQQQAAQQASQQNQQASLDQLRYQGAYHNTGYGYLGNRFGGGLGAGGGGSSPISGASLGRTAGQPHGANYGPMDPYGMGGQQRPDPYLNAGGRETDFSYLDKSGKSYLDENPGVKNPDSNYYDYGAGADTWQGSTPYDYGNAV